VEEPRQDHSSEKSSTWASITREFYVDLLGSLVPGLLFTITAALPAWWSVSLAWRAIYAGTFAALDYAKMAQFRVELLCLLFVLSYVLGCVFYRRDPKVPDQESAAYILWREVGSKTGEEKAIALSRCVIQPTDEGTINSREEARKWAEGEGGQFPYSHLREYLDARGLQHLAKIVPWRGSDKTSHRYRTKMFINILKVRLQYMVPQRCSEIVRNEAHIRMMSSVWYAAVTLQHLCYAAAVLVLISIASIAVRRLLFSVTLESYSLLFFLILMVLAARWLRLTIRKFFHYQRVRETIYVLETAFWAEKTTCPEILKGLNDDQSERP